MKTTFNKIRSHSPCQQGWEKLLSNLGKTKPDDEPLPFLTILQSNGLEDAIWCMKTAPEYDREWRLFSVWCAREVKQTETSLKTLEVSERFANGLASDVELKAAYDAHARAYADANADANAAAINATYAAAYTAANAAAYASTFSAAFAANAAAYASNTAYADAYAAARAKQAEYLYNLFSGVQTNENLCL